jgi:hypothetical protein
MNQPSQYQTCLTGSGIQGEGFSVIYGYEAAVCPLVFRQRKDSVLVQVDVCAELRPDEGAVGSILGVFLLLTD